MKRVLLVSFGLMLAAAYVGCLPADMGGTTGTAGSNGTGTAGSNSQGSAGDNGQGNGGTQGAAGNNGQGVAGDSGQGVAGDSGQGVAGDSGQGVAGSNGGNGNQGSAGDSGTGRGGTTGTGNASGRGGTGGGTAGSGNAGRGGTGGGTAGSTAGTTGSAGKGGTTGSAGSTAGTTGTGGAAGGGGTSGNAVCDSVKKLLDGFEYLLPCGVDQSYSVLVCQNNSPACKTGANGEYMTMGTCNTDTVLTVDGPSTQSCTVTLHVQGVVEPKHYNTGTGKCTTTFGSATEGFASGPAAGGQASGCYPSTSGNYNVYMMHVSDSATVSGSSGLTGTRYFWNAINKNEAHFSYKIDYTTPSITIKGGQKLWMLANDSNKSAIKNCADTSIDNTTIPPGRCDAISVANVNPSPGAAITQPYKGQFILLHVVTAQ